MSMTENECRRSALDPKKRLINEIHNILNGLNIDSSQTPLNPNSQAQSPFSLGQAPTETPNGSPKINIETFIVNGQYIVK